MLAFVNQQDNGFTFPPQVYLGSWIGIEWNCFARGDRYTRLHGGDGICSSAEVLELARMEVGAGPFGKAPGPWDGMELGRTASSVEFLILACTEVMEFVQAWKLLTSLAGKWQLVPVEKPLGPWMEWSLAELLRAWRLLYSLARW